MSPTRAADPPAPGGPARRHQQRLDQQLTPNTPLLGVGQLQKLGQGLEHDPDTPRLAHYLAQLETQHLPIHELLITALQEGPLPAERPAAALTWRIHQLAQPHPRQPTPAPDWRQWADTLNPALASSAQWPTIHSLLKTLAAATNPDALHQQLRNKTPHEIRTALMRLNQTPTTPTLVSPSTRNHQQRATRSKTTGIRR